jgi:HK97 family phage major capsid protein
MKRAILLAAGLIALTLVAALLMAGGDPSLAFSHETLTAVLADVGGAAAAEKKLEELAGQLTKASNDVRESAEKAQNEIKNLGKMTEETKAKADEALSKYGELVKQNSELVQKHGETVSRLVEVEQELAKRREPGDGARLKTIGEMFVDDEKVKAFKSSTRGAVRVEMSRKDIMNVTGTVGSNTSQGNSLVTTMRVPGVVTPPERRLTIRDLVAPGETSQGMVEYVQETGYTNNAGVVTEGSTKATSDLTFELRHAPVRTIAHLFKASRQILDDAPALRSYIDARARYGLRLEEEDELLNGDGTGAHINGLIPQAADFNAAFVVASKQRIDTIRLAILQVFLAEFPASGIVLNPTDWAAIQLTKDGDQRYIIGNPQDGNSPLLWNLPVVETQSMAVTEFLVGAFNMGAQIFDRMEIEVLLSTENSTDFEKNMVTIRAEERLALAVYRPEAFVHGDFDVAT